MIAFSTGDTECNVSPCHRADHTQCRGCHYNGGFYSYEQVFSNGCNECICTRTGSVQCTCTKTVKRKEIRDMTADEISDYQRAVRKVIKSYYIPVYVCHVYILYTIEENIYLYIL